jgi:hypothetical protein
MPLEIKAALKVFCRANGSYHDILNGLNGQKA